MSERKPAPSIDLAQRVEQLERENRKLEKINRVLIERVEVSATTRTDPYAAFEHSVVLAEQVRERTAALNVALGDLKTSNIALSQAKQQAEVAHQRLIDGIESISDAFVLFDSERRIVLYNSKFESVWAATGVSIAQGLGIEDIRRLADQHGLIEAEFRGETDNSVFYRLHDGRWFQVSERPTLDGGLVILYTDITELKQNETARRERALADKSRVLQNTVDNLSQGVVLINAEGYLEVWNQRFLTLSGLTEDELTQQSQFETLIDRCELTLLTPYSHPHLAGGSTAGTIELEQSLANGLVIEIRSHPIQEGGFVNTYTDITERHQYAETLRESEQWIRLITDHVPALIAYVGEDLRFQFTNKVYEDWYGWSREALTGKKISMIHGEEQFVKLKPYTDRALAGESVNFEIEEKDAQGGPRYMLKAYVPNLDAEGRAVGFFVLIRDITERRKTAYALQEAYQTLEQRVIERTSELTKLNDQLWQQIAERKQVEGQLLEASKHAEQANLSKTKFLAAVSHDLLQPLNAARLFTSALQEKPALQSERHLIDSVGSSLDDVESLLSTLVDISKLDAGVIEADVTVFPVSSLLNNIANEFQQVAVSERLQLRYVASSAVICSDSQLLARILRNFLTNAIRYTDTGTVLLGCRRKRSSLVIEVWDTGLGIPEDKLGDIFLEFKRLHGSPVVNDKGLGLGLAIVDKISRMLGHQISVSSVPGKGSMFSVEVPLARAEQLPKETKEEYLPTVGNQLTGVSVWLIDNDPAICRGMRVLLEGWGCQVATVQDKAQLMALLAQHPAPTLLIADYHLDNDENGLDAAITFNQQLARTIPVIMITANYTHELKQVVREQGYLLMNKPVKPMKLKMTLNHLLESAH
ncbi:NahK/ErcS family hybrid sensor histidine kinase/response regulator [Amphritea sp. 1_MG-2023]|uniref:hybrid sensor histidine kinase/response regulator n=1 Tax=Amphritea sp. 1_MG-2023 TaxID=3062670 RepID=UPI0026E13B04|nr:NahK/ErcS family hybrid sensor histidine kinase/response regulator [Amphritea sp. 1_MG-2023]MDO6564577.1 NahK/ErcS family hybrid sensor histidine kinase/response regulator [Amphritea sp. 1_MG-2023]